MRRGVAAASVFFVALLAGCRTEPTWSRALDPALRVEPPRTVGVAYVDLPRGASIERDADRVLHAASTMKLVAEVELYARVDAGEIALDEPIAIVNRFASVVDGSPYALEPFDDGDPEIYVHVGSTLTVRELARRMITRSSNLATNLLLERLGVASVDRRARALGMRSTRIVRCLQDARAFDAGIQNVTTAHDLARCLERIATFRAASVESTRAMLEDLLAQELDEMIPAGLPTGTRVAHKTGEITRIHHDAAIVYPSDPRGPYVLVVTTAGFDSRDESAAVGASIARIVHAHHER